MVVQLILFQLKLWRFYLLSHMHRDEFIYLDGRFITDYHYRRLTPSYQKKKGIVKNIWIGAGIIFIIFPLLPLLAILTLSSTFIAFSILDETE